MGADAAVYDMTETYLKVILIFAPAFLMNNLILCFVRNDGSPQLAMTAMIAGSLSNSIGLAVYFSLRHGDFRSGFCNGPGSVISLIILSVHFIKKERLYA